MNFDPRTKAREEEEDALAEREEKLKLYAVICASLDALGDIENQAVNMTFLSVWDKAMYLENAVGFYRRVDRAKEILGFNK